MAEQPDLTPERLAELRALAAAATPGPWEAEVARPTPDYARVSDVPEINWFLDIARSSAPASFGADERTARYVAAVDPDVVTALVAEVERLRAALMVGNRMMGSMAGPGGAADEALWESFELTLADIVNDGMLAGQAEVTSEEGGADMSKISVAWTPVAEGLPLRCRICWIALARGLVGIGHHSQATNPEFPHEGTGPIVWRYVGDEPVEPDEVVAWAYLEPPERPGPATTTVESGDMAIELPLPRDKVVDLMDALEKSVAAAKAARARHPRPAAGALCDSIGPRIGQQAPRCVLPPGHDGRHQAHESWTGVDGAGPVTWRDW